jgi:hypothetical protein
MIASAACSDGRTTREGQSHPAGAGSSASSIVALRITPQNNGQYHNREVSFPTSSISASRLYQLVKKSWQNAAKAKISAPFQLLLLLGRSQGVSQNDSVFEIFLSKTVSDRRAV